MSNGAFLTIDTAASPRHSSSALGNARKKCLPPTIMHSAGPRGADRPDADSDAPREIASIIPSTEQLVGGILWDHTWPESKGHTWSCTAGYLARVFHSFSEFRYHLHTF